MISYSNLNQQLKTSGIGATSAELHGFLSGLLCGGINDESWQPLLYQFTNDNHAYPTSLLNEVAEVYQAIQLQLTDMDNFSFELWLPEEDDVFSRADALSEWTSNFLLGLGLVQPKLDKEKDEIGEAIDDLHDICQLGYEEDDNEEELNEALEEIIEYVRTVATLFYTHFHPSKTEGKPILH
ncbi:YecA family protein [Mannheimia massilioguelmaensis]|uniref:YecA/YgfB family protein n=1 Tax=Mannheimia massilioguelmaensis TaxID=1604354 RepID=UPI0005C9B4E9|nr:YecA family protein [Mannheimia massilioguelmaensis]